MLRKKAGDVVNLENDIVGKYVERLFKAEMVGKTEEEKGSGLTIEMLAEYGI